MTNLWSLKATESDEIVVPGETVPELFMNAVSKRGDRIALRQKDFGIWQATTWRELGEIAREVAMGLVSLGFEPGECASILSNTNREWMYADLGILCAGGVRTASIPPTRRRSANISLNDSSSIYVFVEDEEQLDKMLEIRDRAPQLRKIIVFDMEGLHRFEDPQVMSLDALRELGRAYRGASSRRVRAPRRRRASPATWPSSCTPRAPRADPKGAMISHHNLVFIVRGYQRMFPQSEADERVCFLPLCHIAERVGGEYSSLYNGAVLNFVENPDTVPENVREIAPTAMTAVPRVWEKFYSGVTIAIKDATRLQQLAYRWAIGRGFQVAERYIAGQPIPMGLRLRYTLGRWLALDNVRRMIGVHRCRIAGTGAAPISPDLVKWYLALGVPMVEAWGQTESSGAVDRQPHRRGSGPAPSARPARASRWWCRPKASSSCAAIVCSWAT